MDRRETLHFFVYFTHILTLSQTLQPRAFHPTPTYPPPYIHRPYPAAYPAEPSGAPNRLKNLKNRGESERNTCGNRGKFVTLRAF